MSGHSVNTVTRRGWSGIKNGELLALAEKAFDILITVDRKLSTQQDISKFKIAVLLIRGKTNRLEDLRPLVPELLDALPTTKPSELTVAGS